MKFFDAVLIILSATCVITSAVSACKSVQYSRQAERAYQRMLINEGK
jgi:hypothetical protein